MEEEEKKKKKLRRRRIILTCNMFLEGIRYIEADQNHSGSIPWGIDHRRCCLTSWCWCLIKIRINLTKCIFLLFFFKKKRQKAIHSVSIKMFYITNDTKILVVHIRAHKYHQIRLSIGITSGYKIFKFISQIKYDSVLSL